MSTRSVPGSLGRRLEGPVEHLLAGLTAGFDYLPGECLAA
jgi:hypothetical protein